MIIYPSDIPIPQETYDRDGAAAILDFRPVSGFAQARDVLESTEGYFDASTSNGVFMDGMLIRTHDGITFEVLGTDATDFHLTTAGGVKLSVPGNLWDARAFGVVADSDALGATGTDNATAFARLGAALSESQNRTVIFPNGYMRSSATLNIEGDGLRNIELRGAGTTLIFTHPTPAENRLYFSLRNPSGTGARARITGFTLDLARASERIGGSDMLSVGGFADIEVSDNVIASADNMGIAINRNLITRAKSVRIEGNRLGNKPAPGGQHSHGAIGDTGIWVLHADNTTLITDNTVDGSGDDAIALAEQKHDDAVSTALVSGNVVRNCQGSAYKTSARNTIFTNNYAEHTMGGMYRIIDLSPEGSTSFPQACQIIGGIGRDIGMADSVSLDVESTIGAEHACGVYLQSPSGDVRITGLQLLTCLEEAVKFTAGDRDLETIEISGCHFENCGLSADGVIRRAPNGTGWAVRGLHVHGNTFQDLATPLLNWDTSLASGAEGDISWHDNAIVNCDFSDKGKLYTFKSTSADRVRNVRIFGDRWQGVSGYDTAVLFLANCHLSDFFCSWFDNEGLYMTAPTGRVRFRNNNNPALVSLARPYEMKRGCRKTIAGSREFNADNTLLTLDPARGYLIHAWAEGNANADYDKVFYSARWDPTTERVNHVTETLGGSGANMGIELKQVTPTDPEDQVFAGTEVLQLQGRDDWPSDPLVNFRIRVQEIDTTDVPAKVV